jgi:hypothetical protein
MICTLVEVFCFKKKLMSIIILVDKSWKERRNCADGKWENIRGRLWHWYSVTVYQVMMVIVSDRRMDDFNWPILFSSFLVSKNYATSSDISYPIMTWYTVTEYQCHRRPRIFSHFPSAQFRRSFHDLSTRITRLMNLAEHPTSLMVGWLQLTYFIQ